MNTQYLAPRVRILFKEYAPSTDVFIYSCAEDPNICQLSMHKEWDNLVFAWVRPDGIFVFKFPKEALRNFGLTLNHADASMIRENKLFKQSLRFTNTSIQQACEYLIDIID